MTLRVAVTGAGPAGFTVVAALLAADDLDVSVDLIDRAELPDGLLRHGPAAGRQRLRGAAAQVDQVLGDERVTYFGNVEVGSRITLDELCRTADAVVLASGAPQDLPLDIAGRDSVGIGTISHVQAWLAGGADVDVDELDLAMDTAVLLGVSADTLGIAEVLCGRIPARASEEVGERLANSRLRYVQLVDPRSPSETSVPEQLPENLMVRNELTPVGVVGRNRARAVRCVHRPDRYGRVVTEDLRAQLLLRQRADSFYWSGIDEARGHIAHDGVRVLAGGTPVAGLYVVGWAGRDPADRGSHSDDAAALLAAIRADREALTPADTTLADVLAARGIEASRLNGWSAAAVTDELLDRFAGEGQLPLADYESLIGQVDED